MNTHRRSNFVFVTVIVGLVLIGGAAGGLQWQETQVLRRSIEIAQEEAKELSQLRAENLRLRARQIPVTELERLRADHAALPRLRAELEAATR